MTFASKLIPQVELLRESDEGPIPYAASQSKQVFKTISTSSSPRPLEKQLIRRSSLHNVAARRNVITRLIATSLSVDLSL